MLPAQHPQYPGGTPTLASTYPVWLRWSPPAPSPWAWPPASHQRDSEGCRLSVELGRGWASQHPGGSAEGPDVSQRSHTGRGPPGDHWSIPSASLCGSGTRAGQPAGSMPSRWGARAFPAPRPSLAPARPCCYARAQPGSHPGLPGQDVQLRTVSSGPVGPVLSALPWAPLAHSGGDSRAQRKPARTELRAPAPSAFRGHWNPAVAPTPSTLHTGSPGLCAPPPTPPFLPSQPAPAAPSPSALEWRPRGDSAAGHPCVASRPGVRV